MVQFWVRVEAELESIVAITRIHLLNDGLLPRDYMLGESF